MLASFIYMITGLAGLIGSLVIAWRAQTQARHLTDALEAISRDAFAQLKAQNLAEKTSSDIQTAQARVQIENLKDELAMYNMKAKRPDLAEVEPKMVYDVDGNLIDLNDYEPV